MGELAALKKEKLHSRVMRIETYRVDDERMLVEATLNDERHVPIRSRTGEIMEPGPVHGMTARLLIGGFPPRILDAEAEMPKVPLDECRPGGEAIKKLIGLAIAPGYSREVKNAMGGIKSCTHLTALVLAVGSAAVQALGAHMGTGEPQPGQRALVYEFIKNTCHLWREDGEWYQRAIREIEEIDDQ